METILLLKKRHAYPAEGEMTVVWAPLALAHATTVEVLPAGVVRLAIEHRPGVERGARIQRGDRRMVVDRVEDWLGRGERLVLTCSPEAD